MALKTIGRIVPVLVAASWAASAQAEVVISCGAAEGRGYFLEGGAVPGAQAGWHDDNISGGKIELTKQGAEYDIRFRDAQGSHSSRQDGRATVVALSETSAVVVILVVYPAGATEVYQFRPSNREVVWAQVKYAGLVDKASVYHSPCD